MAFNHSFRIAHLTSHNKNRILKMSVSKKATTTADFSLAFGSTEQQYGNINLLDFLPKRLAEIFTKDADANCFPGPSLGNTIA